MTQGSRGAGEKRNKEGGYPAILLAHPPYRKEVGKRDLSVPVGYP
jgi:hypothetical protein